MLYIDLPLCAHARPLGGAIKWDAIRIDIMRDGSVYFLKTKALPRFCPIKSGLRFTVAPKNEFILPWMPGPDTAM